MTTSKALARSDDRRGMLKQAGALLASSSLLASTVLSQEPVVNTVDADNDSDAGSEDNAAPGQLTYESPQTTNWRIGLELFTPVTCMNVLATFVVPMDWPEQTVTLLKQNVDPNVTAWETRDVLGGARQVVVRMDRVTAGSTVEVTFDLAVSRSRILPPEQTDLLQIPQRPSRDLRLFMGNSPNIDASNSRIKMLARELEAEPKETAWDRVEHIYDYVQDNIEYVEGPIRNASDALKDQKGDCEDMTSLFVAICRNCGIPARMVWIPEHCYPEFYLETPESEGRDATGIWYPCQAAGTRQFGRMDETRPVLQKGDRFKVPEIRSQVRYVAEYFRCDPKGKGKPRPTFVRNLIDV